MKSGTRKTRSGFTLIEILVVIAIITFLTAALTTVIGTMITTAKVKATRSTIKKVNELLQRRMDAFERELLVKNNATTGVPFYAVPWMSLAGNNTEAAKIYGRKDLFRKQFGQLLSELDPAPSYDTSKHVAETESSEALYHFLTKMEAFGLPPVEADAFIASEVQDTDGDGLMEFVDAWGNPLRFYRWPTRLIKTDGSTLAVDTSEVISLMSNSLPSRDNGTAETNPLNQDPDDPTGYIDAEITAGNTSATDFEANFHTADTWHTPLIVSMGPDAALGLLEPTDTSGFGRLAQPDAGNEELTYDNISNLNLESGSN